MSLLANGIFATDAASADVNSDKSGLPVWPAENPTRVQLEAWFEVAQPWLASKGFSAFIRGDTLRENIKLVDRVFGFSSRFRRMRRRRLRPMK